MKSPSIVKYQADYTRNLTKLGDFHIYENRPMIFQPLGKPLDHTVLYSDPPPLWLGLPDDFTTYSLQSQTPKPRSPLQLSMGSINRSSAARNNFLSVPSPLESPLRLSLRASKSSGKRLVRNNFLSRKQTSRSPLHLSMRASNSSDKRQNVYGQVRNNFLSLPPESRRSQRHFHISLSQQTPKHRRIES
jgi:hypothetical protein